MQEFKWSPGFHNNVKTAKDNCLGEYVDFTNPFFENHVFSLTCPIVATKSGCSSLIPNPSPCDKSLY